MRMRLIQPFGNDMNIIKIQIDHRTIRVVEDIQHILERVIIEIIIQEIIMKMKME